MNFYPVSSEMPNLKLASFASNDQCCNFRSSSLNKYHNFLEISDQLYMLPSTRVVQLN